MIEGLKLDITAAELKEHFQKRAEHHSRKREFYQKQAAELEKGGVSQQHVTNDPVSSLKDSAENHRYKFAYFSFLAEHIIEDETYRFSEGTLRGLEIFERYF